MDTREYVSGSGQLPVTLQATNAAGLPNAPMSETLNVDNDPVSVSLSTPNDPNPTVWVNHAVTVDATPSTGPSGLGGMSCGVNGAAAQSYPAAGLSVNGDGVKTVSCTAWNNAIDPQGNHNSGTSSVTVHIDEAPPALSLEPVNPERPDGPRRRHERWRVRRCRRLDRDGAGGDQQLDGAPDGVQWHPTGGAFRRRRTARSRTPSKCDRATTSATARQPPGRSRCRRGLRPSPR